MEPIPEHADTAGDWALNSCGQIVAAYDKTRVFKGMTHKYFCVCTCGDNVILRRGLVLRPHFAYKAHRQNGCTGTVGCKETEVHYNAKWLLRDIFPQINFWTVCWRDHRNTPTQYTGLGWTATVEKQIPGTLRIADVLLQNSSTGEAVALEVFHTHAVTTDKLEECKRVGVRIIEVVATRITSDCRDLDNELDQCECRDCAKCQREEQARQASFEAFRILREQEHEEELTRMELEELEREQLREQNAAREAERIEQERKRQEIRTREREAREVKRQLDLDQVAIRQGRRQIFMRKMEELQNLLYKAEKDLHTASAIHKEHQHKLPSLQRTLMIEEYNSCTSAVTACQDVLELHKDSGRCKRSRLSLANAGCIACAVSKFRCTKHDDRDIEQWTK
ncbi:hypothetical protein T484DRAFT_1757026 [Baffinella frigidus]|nr:hypothetical protein T484DRAFT_1757026 [Cryptophyta sp. CCMP2293]